NNRRRTPPPKKRKKARKKKKVSSETAEKASEDLAPGSAERAPRDIFYEAQEEEEVAIKNEAEAEPLVPDEDTGKSETETEPLLPDEDAGTTSRWNSFSLLRAIPMLAPLACLAASAVWETSAASVCALWLALELAGRCLRRPLFGARAASAASAERRERKGAFRRGGAGGGLFKIMLATTIFTAVALSGLVLVGGDEAAAAEGAAVESGVGRALGVTNVGQYCTGEGWTGSNYYADCEAGYYCPGSDDGEWSCWGSDGQTADQGWPKIECPAGTWSGAGQGSCTGCAAGKFSSEVRATNDGVCKPCGAGERSVAGATKTPV
ncbi:hypothetical protein TeGR_g7417, partial [Tetraparma gracilis]